MADKKWHIKPVIVSNTLIFILAAMLSVTASCKQNNTANRDNEFTNNLIKTDMD